MRLLLQSRAGRIALAALGVIIVGTLVSMVILWPSGGSDEATGTGLNAPTESAEVTAVSEQACPGSTGDTCGSIEAQLNSGEAAGQTVTIELGAVGFDPGVSVGDGVRVSASPGPPGAPPTYSLSDFERGAPMLWLAIAFAALVIIFGRLRGGLSLVGLVGSLVIVMVYIVPAIEDGSGALGVALSGSLAVMVVTIALAHGFGAKSLAAMLGTAASLILVVVLASIFTKWAHLTGYSSEEVSYLLNSGSQISVQGLLLAGIVIGSLGVLDDVTISQSSTVMALRAANPSLPVREIYTRAIDVGRDHISATVNTLVLAYVGASLPVLLIFSTGGVGFFDAINVELVAKEIVAMLVGSIGLIAAVPLTTLLAAKLAAGLPQEVLLAESEHGHSH